MHFEFKTVGLFVIFMIVLFVGRELLRRNRIKQGRPLKLEDELLTGEAAFDTLIALFIWLRLCSGRVEPKGLLLYEHDTYLGIGIGMFFFIDFAIRKLIAYLKARKSAASS